ncbi:hypothetical protein BKA61DRAFT_637637 [Leptodontidium sp. MPI-SDFR-AT-0119]|nr:hypothetical protein BKA61DRAFT_637637 [Leptodontidium sp. MPI-SDFR-AT-0119]
MTPSLKLISLAILLVPITSVLASNDCAASTWSKAGLKIRQVTTSSTSKSPLSSSIISSSSKASISTTSTSSTSAATSSTATNIINVGNVTAGQVNCRYSSTTDSEVNYYTCTTLSQFYKISTQVFFTLNPGLALDCSNIQPNTPYCVSGFLEPLRSTSGLCGPKNNNATCLGTDFQCCNSQTWTCGNSTQDCAAGTCYEGACAGDTVWSTDGTCGEQFGDRSCAGIWGDCCNFDGKCGTGASFCGADKCQSGNCISVRTSSSTKQTSSSVTTSSTAKTTSSVKISTTSSTAKPTSSVKTTTSSSATKTSTSVTKSSSTTTLPAISSLPSCGQLCFNNLIGQYSSLGCSSPDPSCLCSNVNFGFGIRDCSNGACGTAVASTVIAYESAYCSSALATRRPVTTATPTATGVASLPSCGQTCFNNMLGQYSSLGCATADPACLCKNINFYYGLRDCSNAVCGSDTNAVSTILAFESSYCASATAAPTTK